jgi:hypothetical protein
MISTQRAEVLPNVTVNVPLAVNVCSLPGMPPRFSLVMVPPVAVIPVTACHTKFAPA